MSKIQINKTSPKSAEETFDKIKAMLENDADLKKVDSNYKCQFDAASLSGTAKGKMFEAALKVAAAGTSSNVDLTVTLPLLASPFKGKIEEMLQSKLTKILA